MMGAVLAYGDEAALSHRSGSTWWEILRSARTKVDVTVPARTRRAQTGIDLQSRPQT